MSFCTISSNRNKTAGPPTIIPPGIDANCYPGRLPGVPVENGYRDDSVSACKLFLVQTNLFLVSMLDISHSPFCHVGYIWSHGFQNMKITIDQHVNLKWLYMTGHGLILCLSVCISVSPRQTSPVIRGY